MVPDIISLVAKKVKHAYEYGPVWFGCGFLKAAVKNLLWKNSCEKFDVKKM